MPERDGDLLYFTNGATANQRLLLYELREWLNSFPKTNLDEDQLDLITDVILDTAAGLRSMKVIKMAAKDIEEFGQLPLARFDHIVEHYKGKDNGDMK